MGTGYNRTDTTNNIATGNIINASDLDAEYDAIDAAFDETTGHDHGGASGNGAPITKLGPVQDVVVSTTAVTPKTDNTIDLGSSLLEFKDLYIDGTANIDSLVADTADINGGTVDGAVIGGSTAAAGTFTTATATTGNITTVNATTVDTTNLEVTNIKAKDGTSAGSIANSTGVVTLASTVLTTTDINGGTIDNTAIGASTPAAGTFTQVDITAQGDLRLQDTTGGQYVALQAPGTVASSYTLTLPVDDGTNGQALITDGNGVLSWSTAASGDVYGPASATDNAVARFDSTTGKIIQNSVVIIADTTGDMTGVGTLSSGAITTTGVLTVPAGTVSAPAITTTGDTNTGIFFPAADTIAFTEGGVEAGRFTSTGALQLNTNLTFSGTGNRITGDFSNATVASRVSFQTSTVNSGTFLGAIPNGTVADSTGSGFLAFGNSDVTSSNTASLLVFKNLETRLSSGSNTGTFYPLTMYTGGSERLRIDTSGNVGIGTSSPAVRLHVSGGTQRIQSTGSTSDAFLTLQNDVGTQAILGIGSSGNSPANSFYVQTNAGKSLVVSAGGNVGIGTSSPSVAAGLGLVLNGAGSQTRLAFKNTYTGDASTDGVQFVLVNGTSEFIFQNRESDGTFAWETNGTERMRIDSSGNLLVGTTAVTGSEKVGILTSGNTALRVANNNASFADTLQFNVASRAASSAYNFLYCAADGVGQVAIRGDGVIFAQNTTVQSISDVRTKENIVDSQEGIETINALRPVRFDFKEGFGNNRKNQLGFIAQEIEQVFPDAVDTWGESDDPENPYKSVGTTALIPVLVKAIQEQQALIKNLTTRLNALEGK